MDQISFQFSIDLYGLEITLNNPRQFYEEDTSQTLFFHETSYPWSYGPENLTDQISFQFSIDLTGPQAISIDPT